MSISLASTRVQGGEALFTGLDKITGRITSFSIKVGSSYKFGSLQITPHVCYLGPIGDTEVNDSFVEIQEFALDKDPKLVFSGWMFANSPGLNGLDHSIYDIWLTGCKL